MAIWLVRTETKQLFVAFKKHKNIQSVNRCIENKALCWHIVIGDLTIEWSIIGCRVFSDFQFQHNPVPGLDRDTYLSPGSVWGKKFGFWYGVLSYIGSYYTRIS